MKSELNKLESAFDFSVDEPKMLLQKSTAEVCIHKNKYTGAGEVYLELLPSAGIYYYGYFQGVPPQDALSGGFKPDDTIFSINGCRTKGFQISCGGDANKREYNIRWCPPEPIEWLGDETTQIARIVFHLFNFVDMRGTRQSLENNVWIQHVDLASNEWKIEIKSLSVTSDNIKKLKAEGGYRLTHIGGLERVDGALFTGKEAVGILKILRIFLTFAKGCWCDPICAVGFDEKDNRVWEFLCSPNEAWQSLLSWYDPRNSSQLETLFPIFIEQWKSEDWDEALHEIIYWYQNANHSARGIDVGIIIAQSAIERLSYEYSVKSKKLLTVNGFKDLWASDKFRLLFSSMGIPLEIPKETPKLQELAKALNWLDAPHALTEIRNSLVHPQHKQRDQLLSALDEAWNLSLWCLEMSILAVCGYTGTYGNRLKQRWVGHVENVPWIK